MSMPLPDPPATLAIGYASESPATLLERRDTLAVLGFGACDLPDDARALRVGLATPDGDARVECWRTSGAVRAGRDGDLRWSSDGTHLFFACELDEHAHGGIDAAAEHAYARIGALVGESSTPHLLRLWNYLDAINLGDGDDERYRLFCSGRARGMRAHPRDGYPAATAIGRHDGVRVLQVYGLAARTPGTPVENPRQTSAWRYPRQYGPTAPTFARGMRDGDGHLLISGTAAVVGHASRHDENLRAQLDETIENLRSLPAQAGSRTPLGRGSMLKVYVRDPADADSVRTQLRERCPDIAQPLFLAGDICRRELLVEIDGTHRLA